jgi:GntR family transcriptional regulator
MKGQDRHSSRDEEQAATKIEEVVQVIKERIEEGIYTVGSKLPAERELAEELQVSRVTVHAAMLRLASENLVDAVPRAGAFVRSEKAKALVASGPELQHSGSFIRAMERQGRATFVRFLEPSSIRPAGEEIGEKLRVEPDTQVLRRYRVHLVDRVPYRILDSYYLASLLGDLKGHDEGYIPLFKWLREHTGKRAAHVEEHLTCRMPTASEAKLLAIGRMQPIVAMDRRVGSEDGTLFEYTRIVANAALHEFVYTYELDEEASQ